MRPQRSKSDVARSSGLRALLPLVLFTKGLNSYPHRLSFSAGPVSWVSQENRTSAWLSHFRQRPWSTESETARISCKTQKHIMQSHVVSSFWWMLHRITSNEVTSLHGKTNSSKQSRASNFLGNAVEYCTYATSIHLKDSLPSSQPVRHHENAASLFLTNRGMAPMQCKARRRSRNGTSSAQSVAWHRQFHNHVISSSSSSSDCDQPCNVNATISSRRVLRLDPFLGFKLH